MNRYFCAALVVSVLFVLILLTGCGTNNNTSVQEVKSSLARIENPSVSPGTLQQLALDNRQFALGLYRRLAAQYGGQNLFFSPCSISIALAMAYAGAEGDTETQMAGALHYTLAENELHAAFNEESRQLNSRGQGAAGVDGEGFRLNVINSIWGQTDYPFLDAFLDCLALNYGAGLRIVDFMNKPEECRTTINGWVEEQTEDRIEELLPQGSISTLTRMVLVNAVYFNAAWANTFEESATRQGEFHLLGGGTVQSDIMHQTEQFSYLNGDGFKAIALPYDGNELAMILVIPDAGQFAVFESNLTIEQLDGIVSGLSSARVALSMPKWQFETPSISLREMLRQMGMTDAFQPDKADFSGLANVTEPLFISDVVHKAFVAVDEEGTEAAAATAVIIGTTSMPPPPVPLDIDRPFIYFIRDIATDTIVFMGRVTDPK
jgi:serpin B